MIMDSEEGLPQELRSNDLCSMTLTMLGCHLFAARVEFVQRKQHLDPLHPFLRCTRQPIVQQQKYSAVLYPLRCSVLEADHHRYIEYSHD